MERVLIANVSALFDLWTFGHYGVIYISTIIEKRLQKQIVTWQSLKEKGDEIWEKIDAGTVRNL